ncbi:MAG: FAD-dependent oxidoreductase [Gemmatimonadaceae bacterium]
MASQNTSVWAATAQVPTFAPLTADTNADVCVVGAGIAGLTTAYLLTQSGKSVVVLDDGPIAHGMTGVTTAHLVNALDDRYFDLERLHGERGSRLAAESHTAAIDLIEQVVGRERIACDFIRLDGYLFCAPEHDETYLNDELEAAQRAGLHEVRKAGRAPLAFDTGPCLRFPNQGQFHPLKYLSGVASAIERGKGRIFTGTHATKISGGHDATVETQRAKVRCGHIVVATNTPINDLVAIHTKQAPYMTYVIATRVQRGSVPRALVWDTGDVYHFVRLHSPPNAGYDFLLVGGEDHRTGYADDAPERFARLGDWMRERYLTVGEVEYAWAGQIMESADRLALIGPSPSGERGVFVVTGESGTGMTHATLAAEIIADEIAGRENVWASLYDPARRTYGAVTTFVKENLSSTARLIDWLSPGEVSSIDEIARDTGAVLRRGLKKIAVYRDERGALHERVATCMHAGCIVRWNSIERTWDCPCHGSRYDRFGRVVSGPAVRDLAPVEAA